jgi:hypothetical protein
MAIGAVFLSVHVASAPQNLEQCMATCTCVPMHDVFCTQACFYSEGGHENREVEAGRQPHRLYLQSLSTNAMIDH